MEEKCYCMMIIRANSPRLVRIFLAEKGIEIPTKQIMIMKGEHKSPEFRKISPGAKLPALELDNGTIFWKRSRFVVILKLGIVQKLLGILSTKCPVSMDFCG